MRYITEVDGGLNIDSTKNVEPKIIYVSGSIDESAAQTFRKDVSEAESTAPAKGQEILPIVIDSYGGEIYALLSMVDTLKACSLPVATVVEGKAMSAAAVLFSCGSEGYRFIGPNATVMIHEASQWTGGKVEEVKADATQLEKLNSLIFAIMTKNCGKPNGYFGKKVHERSHADWFLTPRECVKHNLANHIRIPTMTFSIKISCKFK